MKSVQQVAELAGVSVRTLHHYHAIGLLVPLVDPGNGYRLYDRVHLLRLQQILVYRGLGFSLAEVKALLDDPGMDRGQALRRQRDLVRERLQADRALLRTLERTLEELEGGETMKDEDMFAGLPAGTEEQWNREVDRRWGDGQFEASRRRIEAGGAAEFRREAEDLREAIGAACREGWDPEGDAARSLVERHHAWVRRAWPAELEAYVGLAELYLSDPRFREHYDGVHPGSTEWLAKAMRSWAER